MIRTLSKALSAALSIAIFSQSIACVSSPPAPGDSPSESAEAARPTASFTGEELFQGIYFGVGPAAEIMPALWEQLDMRGAPAAFGSMTKDELAAEAEAQLRRADVAPEIREGVSAFVKDPKEREPGRAQARTPEQWRAEILAAIQEADPSFFERFGRDMQSGDHLRVAAAMELGSKRFFGAFGGPRDLAKPLDPTPGNVNYNVNVNVNVLAVAVLAVAVAVVVVFIFVKPAPHGGPTGLEPDTELQREIAVDYLANRLGG